MTRNQVNVVYRNAKLGNIKVEKWAISLMYDRCNVTCGYSNYADYQREFETMSHIVNLLLENKFEEAQHAIDCAYDLSLRSLKFQKTADRTLLA